MNPATVCDDTIVQEVTINAPAERIFAALTNPDELLKWWAAEGKFRLVHAECDLRPGGKWVMRVAGGCGPDQSSSGVPGLKCASGEERHWTRRAYGTREEVPA
jgi:uncharacterized protein YndB with AHSA1/START domain